MKAVGIIAEYNPFHGGHAYQIREAKKLTGADYAVVIMNGAFVQRGEPAAFDKYTRTKQALEGDADLVFELPVRFGISSAGDFAMGGVMALEALDVPYICFGSECGELKPLTDIATTLFKEPENFRKILDGALRQGLSYPAAQAKALRSIFDDEKYSEIINQPNNILGIEYCIAIQKIGAHMIPVTIRREGQGYHDTTLSENMYPSATSLRRKMVATKTPHLVLDDFSAALGYALLSSDDLAKYKDISSDLADRIQGLLPTYRTASELINNCQTRAFTDGRIRRGLMQCLLGLRETKTELPYLRLLGMKKEASALLSEHRTSSISILSRLAVDSKELDENAHSLLAQDIFASDLYRQTWCRKYQCELPNEYQRSVIVM